MIFKKNVGPKERISRIVAGILMILCGLAGLHASALGILFAVAGGLSLVTGLIRYCPVCQLNGPKSGGC